MCDVHVGKPEDLLCEIEQSKIGDVFSSGADMYSAMFFIKFRPKNIVKEKLIPTYAGVNDKVFNRSD